MGEDSSLRNIPSKHVSNRASSDSKVRSYIQWDRTLSLRISFNQSCILFGELILCFMASACRRCHIKTWPLGPGGVSVIERECIRNKESAPHLFVFASWKSLKGKQQVNLYRCNHNRTCSTVITVFLDVNGSVKTTHTWINHMLDLRTKVSRTVILEKTPPPRTPPTNWQAGLHQLGFPPHPSTSSSVPNQPPHPLPSYASYHMFQGIFWVSIWT